MTELIEHEAIRVEVVNLPGSVETTKAAELASWVSFQMTGTEPAFRILSNSPLREKANILVCSSSAGNTTGNVFLGTREQVQNRQGGIYTEGANFDYTAAPEVWCVGDGVNALTVTVLDERYQS